MSDETEEATAPAPAPAAPLSPAQQKIEQAMEALGRAMASAPPAVKQILGELKAQTEQAARMSGAEFDKRLEFCYAIVFSPDLDQNSRVSTAAQTYIDAVKAAL